jgi:hypothetical protein
MTTIVIYYRRSRITGSGKRVSEIGSRKDGLRKRGEERGFPEKGLETRVPVSTWLTGHCDQCW